MSNILKKGAAFLARHIKNNGESVGYDRGGALNLADVNATLGRTDMQVVGANAITEFQAVDFLFDYEDLQQKVNAVVATLPDFEPLAGDVITYDARQYQVQNIPGGRCFSFGDAFRKTIRVHTKLVTDLNTNS